MQNQCAEIRIRAERRGGELLKEQENNKGAATPLHDERALKIPKLKDLGIAEYRLRIDRKLGEWSAGLENVQGDRTDLTCGNVAISPKPKKEYFKEIDISNREMCRYE